MGRTVKVVLVFEQRQIILVLTLVAWVPCLSMCRPEHRFDMIQTADLLALGDCHRKRSIAKHASKRGALTFKTKTLTALRAVAGDECEVKEAMSCCEPADGNDRRDLAGPLEIKYVSCVYKDNGPWPVVAAVVAGESPSNPQTPTSEFLDFPRTIVQFGHDCGG